MNNQKTKKKKITTFGHFQVFEYQIQSKTANPEKKRKLIIKSMRKRNLKTQETFYI